MQDRPPPTAVDPPRPRCPSCGELLGVYEPLVLDTGDDHPVRTSLLRLSPDARAAAAGSLYHASCRAAGPPPLSAFTRPEPTRRRPSSP